jgi:hypothetical protein
MWCCDKEWNVIISISQSTINQPTNSLAINRMGWENCPFCEIHQKKKKRRDDECGMWGMNGGG